jgi:hypothetical protein
MQQCRSSSLLQVLKHAAIEPAAAATLAGAQPPRIKVQAACSCALGATQALHKCAAFGGKTNKQRTAYGTSQGPANNRAKVARAAGLTADDCEKMKQGKAGSGGNNNNRCCCNSAAERSFFLSPESCCLGLSKAGAAAMHMLRHQQVDQFALLELQHDLQGVLLPCQAQRLGSTVARACSSKVPGGSKTVASQHARGVSRQ